MLQMMESRIVFVCVFMIAFPGLGVFGQTISPCPAELEVGQNLTLTCKGLSARQSVLWQYSKDGTQSDIGTCTALPSLNPCTTTLDRYMHASRPADDTSVLTISSLTNALYDGAQVSCAALQNSALTGTADCQIKVLPKTADVRLTCPNTWTDGKAEVLECGVKSSRFTASVCSGHLADNIDFKFRPSGSGFWINQCQVHLQSGRCDGKFTADGCRCRELSNGRYMLEMIVTADQSRLGGGSWNCVPACVNQSLQNPLSLQVAPGCSSVSFEKQTTRTPATTTKTTKRSTTVTSTRKPTATRRQQTPAEATKPAEHEATKPARTSSTAACASFPTVWKIAALVIIFTWAVPARE